jgi:hypothetical protein
MFEQLFVRIVGAEGDILGGRAGEQRGFLRRVGETVGASRAGSAAVEATPSSVTVSGLGIEQAQGEAEHGRLAGAARADQCNELAGLHRQGEIRPAPRAAFRHWWLRHRRNVT